MVRKARSCAGKVYILRTLLNGLALVMLASWALVAPPRTPPRTSGRRRNRPSGSSWRNFAARTISSKLSWRKLSWRWISWEKRTRWWGELSGSAENERPGDEVMSTTFTELQAAEVPVRTSCELTGISRATHYRHADPTGPVHGPWPAPTPPPSALGEAERDKVLAGLSSPGYADLSIPQIWARELDEGRYYCSRSTMYRIARAAGQVRERRRQATHPPRVRPELVAYGPNQVWSWDITAPGRPYERNLV